MSHHKGYHRIAIHIWLAKCDLIRFRLSNPGSRKGGSIMVQGLKSILIYVNTKGI